MGRIPLALLAWLLLAGAPAAAQQPEDRSVLLILDSSKSMNEPAGPNGTRLDAAKAATKELLEAVPADARVGLRVYGARVSETTRARGCRDTELVLPVGAVHRDQVERVVDGLQGKGRTPIGRSLLAAPKDLPPNGGRRTVILVSDGGDNCAPPSPCRAAQRVARGGLELTISVVGLQVNPRVRRQLECIARAGGGTYVDARDPDALREELLAAFARAARTYEPSGTPVEGGPAAERATALGSGLFLDRFANDQERFYSVELKPGQRLFAAATAIPADEVEGSAVFETDLLDPGGERVAQESTAFGGGADVFGELETLAVRTEDQIAAPGIESPLAPGRYTLRVAFDGDLEGPPVPVELAVEALDPGQRPGRVRRPGRLPTQAKPTPTPSAAPAGGEEDGGGAGAPALAGIGGGGLLLGLVGGWLAARRRRRP
jgi:Ca-activated chloride channel family protein